jgi:rhodanese-related sulfurtransferase
MSKYVRKKGDLDSDTPRTQLSKQLAKTKLGVSFRPALGDISNRNSASAKKFESRSSSVAQSQNSDSASSDSRCTTPVKNTILSPIHEHTAEQGPNRWNGSLFSPIIDTPSPAAPIGLFNLSGGFSDDSEDLEVSRFSNLSGFRPINDFGDLSCDSDDCHPLLAQLPNGDVKENSLKRKRCSNQSPSKKRSRTQSCLTFQNPNFASQKPLPSKLNLRERAASINPKPDVLLGRWNTLACHSRPHYPRSQSVMGQAVSVGTDSSEYTSDCLKDISVEQVAQLVTDGQLVINNILFKKFVIIDARFNYEYDGGHIKGAINIPKVEANQWQESLQSQFFSPENGDKIHSDYLIIFHCEFSSKRGPALRAWFRKNDRSSNQYPRLNYPHLYLMKSGYKSYYQTISDTEAFEPSKVYVPELDERFATKRAVIKKNKRQADKPYGFVYL